VIRTGTAVDMDQIMMVRTAVHENHLSRDQLANLGVTPASMCAQMQSGELGCWVSLAQEEVVGFSMAHRDTANIFALFVLPEHEGEGRGSALIAACERWLKTLGHSHAHLDTNRNTRAAEFYRRQGWIESDEPPTRPEDALFSKPLG
jgi:GNAT superfamily N-acetyltransferase